MGQEERVERSGSRRGRKEGRCQNRLGFCFEERSRSHGCLLYRLLHDSGRPTTLQPPFSNTNDSFPTSLFVTRLGDANYRTTLEEPSMASYEGRKRLFCIRLHPDAALHVIVALLADSASEAETIARGRTLLSAAPASVFEIADDEVIQVTFRSPSTS